MGVKPASTGTGAATTLMGRLIRGYAEGPLTGTVRGGVTRGPEADRGRSVNPVPACRYPASGGDDLIKGFRRAPI